MQNIAVYILSFFIGIQTIGINPDSLSKFDDFWSHYQTHQQEFDDDLLTFLDLHYGSGKAQHQNTHDGHENLPFGDIHSAQVLIVFVNFSEIKVEPLEFETQKHSNFNYQDDYISTHLGEAFQPPKYFDRS
ncbi:hypothetical protein [Flavobacterium sp. CS20]|jgi:hypothetical protein|uniref:hypothetical protein n=1 Tax=Flavobacterium sp. CS20 TaxID=2775246 RepID=UPI001B3A2CB7|nr:hypothetical protein [Flavobacterium sp. CS20]QTY28248.1 hypothetical protein IGB25_07170 [Flavobacterium sp. CS20]